MRSATAYLAPLLIFSYPLARALEITVPPAPVPEGAAVSVGWTAVASDPLSFTLALLCGGKITLQDAVDRGSPANTTGQVSYLTGCLGDHFVQALAANSSDTLPFATSASFQVVSAVAPTTVVTLYPTLTTMYTIFPTLLASSTPSAQSPQVQSSTERELRTLRIVSALLGATTLIFLVLLIVLYIQHRKFCAPRLWPFNGHLDAVERGDHKGAQNDADLQVAALTREVHAAHAEIARLRGVGPTPGGQVQALSATSLQPPSYHKR
ncbi:hypothetical protein FB451DRAFT_643108 [Mycena latifolia]|nr:hypothetical protein FB451DRAFT_643108 [Mycena latifolia]